MCQNQKIAKNQESIPVRGREGEGVHHHVTYPMLHLILLTYLLLPCGQADTGVYILAKSLYAIFEPWAFAKIFFYNCQIWSKYLSRKKMISPRHPGGCAAKVRDGHPQWVELEKSGETRPDIFLQSDKLLCVKNKQLFYDKNFFNLFLREEQISSSLFQTISGCWFLSAEIPCSLTFPFGLTFVAFNFDCHLKSSLISGESRISPRRGSQLPGGRGHQHMILPNFPQNCMELKEFGPGGGVPRAPLFIFEIHT